MKMDPSIAYALELISMEEYILKKRKYEDEKVAEEDAKKRKIGVVVAMVVGCLRIYRVRSSPLFRRRWDSEYLVDYQFLYDTSIYNNTNLEE